MVVRGPANTGGPGRTVGQPRCSLVSSVVTAAEAERRARLLASAELTLRGLSEVLDPLADRFIEAGHELYLVGGSVRDAVLGRLGTDLDFTTDARPERVQELLRGWVSAQWDTGIAFGTISATKDGQQIEITTYRADAYDRVSRNPQVAYGTSLAADLVRRDFSVNAMAVRVGRNPEFVDPHNGLGDLLTGVLDTPGAPEDSFADDPLRMLRAARFISQLGFAVAPRLVVAMTAMAEQIARITPERVRAELDKLLCGEHPGEGIDLLVRTGLAERVLPEVPAMRLEIDEHHQHKDVYAHSLTVLAQAVDRELADPAHPSPDLVLRWAALLHDVGKPATRRHEPAGGVSFHHHEVVGAKLVRKRLRALRHSKQVTEEVARLVFLHLRFHGYGSGEWTDSAVRRYVTDAGPQLAQLHKLVRADSTTRNARRAAMLQATYDDLQARIERIAEAEDLARVRPDLDGNAIMALLGVPAGPVVGRAWQYLKELRLDRGPLSPQQAEAALLQWARAEGIVDGPARPFS